MINDVRVNKRAYTHTYHHYCTAHTVHYTSPHCAAHCTAYCDVSPMEQVINTNNDMIAFYSKPENC